MLRIASSKIKLGHTSSPVWARQTHRSGCWGRPSVIIASRSWHYQVLHDPFLEPYVWISNFRPSGNSLIPDRGQHVLHCRDILTSLDKIASRTIGPVVFSIWAARISVFDLCAPCRPHLKLLRFCESWICFATSDFAGFLPGAQSMQQRKIRFQGILLDLWGPGVWTFFWFAQTQE